MHGYREEYTCARAPRVYGIGNATSSQIVLKYSRRMLLSTMVSIISARIGNVAWEKRIAGPALLFTGTTYAVRPPGAAEGNSAGQYACSGES